ncbi:hypothetical protein T4D_9580 [Trichinella pseudospiralis]|uniref:Uncharacterized protein n=1 Tax=Trichinella pseudospiralis TaxID=6337 RepID=A0A0V1FTN5_TRIPS|nr:hypothetical protein T4D_9580 [Trichinella pseudospiralis]
MSLFVSCSGVWDVVELNCNRISSDPPAHKLENPCLGVASCKSDCAAVGGNGGGGGGGGVGVRECSQGTDQSNDLEYFSRNCFQTGTIIIAKSSN